MMWMPLRTPNKYACIRGFQRRVWCPKWTPASSNWRMVKDGIAMGEQLLFRLSHRGTAPGVAAATPERPSGLWRPQPRSRVRIGPPPWRPDRVDIGLVTENQG